MTGIAARQSSAINKHKRNLMVLQDNVLFEGGAGEASNALDFFERFIERWDRATQNQGPTEQHINLSSAALSGPAC